MSSPNKKNSKPTKKRVKEMPRFRLITQYESDFIEKHARMTKAMIDDVTKLALSMVGKS